MNVTPAQAGVQGFQEAPHRGAFSFACPGFTPARG
jgi:hypothetical protein